MKGIYKYTDLENDKIVYIGKDSHIDENRRYKAHLQPSRYDAQPFNRVIQNNPERYEYSVLYSSDFVSDDDLKILEMSFIERYNPKFNFTRGGDGSTGCKPSEETRQKMSDAKKGNVPWNKDKTLSEEHKQKLSKARNTSGYLNVYKHKCKTCKKGFLWIYNYSENGKRKSISSVDIKKLEKKVKARGFEWREFLKQ